MASLSPLKNKVKLKCMQSFSPYRAVNTSRLAYKSHSVNLLEPSGFFTYNKV